MKKFIISIAIMFIEKALIFLSNKDKKIIQELNYFDKNYQFILQINEVNKQLNLIYLPEKGLIRYKKNKYSEYDCKKLIIKIKDVYSGYLMMTGQIGTNQAYCENRIQLNGNISDSIVFVRILTKAERYLFPKFMARKIMLRLPKMGVYEIFLKLRLFLGIIFI